MTVLSSTGSHVNQILKQGEISRNPELQDNPLNSQQEISWRQCSPLPKPIEASRRFSPVSVGFKLDPRQVLKQDMVNVLSKIRQVPGTLLTLALWCSQAHSEPRSP